jgi:hypothetical protein
MTVSLRICADILRVANLYVRPSVSCNHSSGSACTVCHFFIRRIYNYVSNRRTVKSDWIRIECCYAKLQGRYRSNPPINEFGTDRTNVVAYFPESHTCRRSCRRVTAICWRIIASKVDFSVVLTRKYKYVLHEHTFRMCVQDMIVAQLINKFPYFLEPERTWPVSEKPTKGH